MIEIIGWLGGIALSVCAIPQAWQTYKTKNTSGISFSYLFLWFKGETFTLLYLFSSDWNSGVFQWPLYLNYCLNLFLAGYLLYAKHRYKGSAVKDFPPGVVAATRK